jgi:hypothetical protein
MAQNSLLDEPSSDLNNMMKLITENERLHHKIKSLEIEVEDNK